MVFINGQRRGGTGRTGTGMMSYRQRRFRKHPLVIDQAERLRAILGFSGPNSHAAMPPPGVGLRKIPLPFKPVNAERLPVTPGAVARRTGLFVVAYAPLVAGFAALNWPAGWSAAEAAPFVAWTAALASVAALPLAATLVAPGPGRRKLVRAGIAAAGVAVVGALLGWHGPTGYETSIRGTSAVAAGVAAGICVATLHVALAILVAGRRSFTGPWRVTYPGRLSGARGSVEYLGTFLFPLSVARADAAWVAPAVAAYAFLVYVSFVRSRHLVLVNPMLSLLGVGLYDVLFQRRGGAPHHVLLMTRRRLASDARVDAVKLGDDCYVIRRPNRGF
jgi:hypothetical protein